MHCETCNGKRFNRETLEVRYKGKSISDVLEMTIDEAVDFFQPIPKNLLKSENFARCWFRLYYSGTTIYHVSGGEAQRIKLATELAKNKQETRFTFLMNQQQVCILKM